MQNGECKLCKNIKPLCNSHIIPESFYKPMYDEKGRLLLLSTDTNEKTKFKQKGIYERLLCEDCEQHINEYEKHAKRLFYDEFQFLDTENQNEIKIVNLDYQKIKLFQLSLLWRASVTKNEFFALVSLGPHEGIIRNMILNNDPGLPHEYGCIIIGIVTEENFAFDVVMRPERGRADGHICYRFILGGCIWLFVVSNHSKLFEQKDYFLTNEGTQLMRSISAKQVPFIMTMIQNLMHSGKLE